jgi:hypothetical protein
MLLGFCCSKPVDNIDFTDPEVIRAWDETVLGIKKSRYIDVYDIHTDTLSINNDTMILLLTVLQNDEVVYDEVRYEVLCPNWMTQGQDHYQWADIYE